MKVQLDGRMFNWMELGPDEPLCKIGLYEWKEGIPRPYPISTGIKLDTDDIQELYKRLSAGGLKFKKGAQTATVGRMVSRLPRPVREYTESNTGPGPLQVWQISRDGFRAD